jgi:hypothetical protein
VMGFHPSVLYRPVPGLVALFARGGGEATSRKPNPRVPHSNTYAASGFSYVDVVKATMERGNFGGNDNMGGNGQRPGGGPSSF